jgi:hypothetical protein
MSLAQVVYRMSTDADFTELWRHNPEDALEKKGLKLTREELAFLSNGLTRGGFGSNNSVVSLMAGFQSRNWM